MPSQQVTQPQWNALPRETRSKIATLFSLPKTGIVETEFLNNVHTVKCDGYSHADLAHMTIERMQAVTNSKEADPAILLQAVVKFVNGIQPEVMPVQVATGSVEAQAVPPEAPKASKWAEKLCCGSRGTRHLKNCHEAARA